MCIGAPKMPAVVPPPAPPTTASPDVQGARSAAAQRALPAGIPQTLLTGPQGVLNPQTAGQKTLLGG